jgi:hypothetical protein
VVTITALISIAERVGANRICKAEGRFHYPLGDPTLTPTGERAWRHQFLQAAVQLLTWPVDQPTVHEVAAITQHAKASSPAT